MGGGRACYEAIHGPPPGKILETTHGSTHYILEGPTNSSNKPLVVLQHGLGSSAARFDLIAKNLVKLGYQVLRYDFYDRGYSETDATKYPIENLGVHPLDFTIELYLQQLEEVLKNLGLDDTDLIHCGHSLGGLTGIAYAAAHTNQVKGLVLMDAVCLPVSKPLMARMADLPIIGDLLVRNFGAKTYMKFARASCVDPNHPTTQSFLEKVERNVNENPRYFSSIRSTNGKCRGMVGTAEPEFRKCCEASIPIHLIWGKADTSVPYENCCQMRAIAEELGTKVSETSFEGLPHNVMFEDAKPEECSKSVCNFVESVSS